MTEYGTRLFTLESETALRVELTAPPGYRQEVDVLGKTELLWPFCEEYHG